MADERVGVTTRRMASLRAQAPAVPPPSLGARPDHAAETTRRQGKPEGKRRAAFVSGSSDTTARVSKSSLDFAVNNGASEFPERRRSARLAEKQAAEAPSRVASPEPFQKSARLAAKPARSFAPAKRTGSKTAASETRAAGTSTKSHVSKRTGEAPSQTGEGARREPLSPLSSTEAARRDENAARGAVNGDGARKRSDPSAPRARSRRIRGRPSILSLFSNHLERIHTNARIDLVDASAFFDSSLKKFDILSVHSSPQLRLGRQGSQGILTNFTIHLRER